MYVDLVVARHLVPKAHVLEDHTLQVLNLVMMEDTPLIALTEFIRNFKASVFAFMQSAPPIEAEEYGLPEDGKANK